jgi:hypothetical protein
VFTVTVSIVGKTYWLEHRALQVVFAGDLTSKGTKMIELRSRDWFRYRQETVDKVLLTLPLTKLLTLPLTKTCKWLFEDAFRFHESRSTTALHIWVSVGGSAKHAHSHSDF